MIQNKLFHIIDNIPLKLSLNYGLGRMKYIILLNTWIKNFNSPKNSFYDIFEKDEIYHFIKKQKEVQIDYEAKRSIE